MVDHMCAASMREKHSSATAPSTIGKALPPQFSSMGQARLTARVGWPITVLLASSVVVL